MNRSGTIPGLLLTLAIQLATSTLRAQEALAPSIGNEHRHRYTWTGDLSSYQEKLLLESFGALDPEMRMDVDRPSRMIKLLAYRPLDAAALRAVAAQHGVSLRVPRETAEMANERNNQ